VKHCILDASVAIKGYIIEEMSEIAERLLDRAERGDLKIVVPEHFYVEVANVCFKKVRKGLITVPGAVRTFDNITRLPFTRYPDFELATGVLNDAFEYEVPVYDAMYLALADAYGVPFVTADEALIRKCKGRFELIEYLGDI